MKFWISLYQLYFNNPKEKAFREGFLIKIQDNNNTNGYADCFPWPEFGDPTIKECIAEIKNPQNALIKKSLYFAKKDAQARVEKKSLFTQTPIKNHKLIFNNSILNQALVDEMGSQGFSTVKVKVGTRFVSDRNAIELLAKNGFKLRLDFNGKMNGDYFSLLIDHANAIEYIEDPYNSEEEWNQFSQKTTIPLAFDQAEVKVESVNFQLQIIKPAKQKLSDIKSNQVVFTSYLDHPVGIAHAFSEAQAYGESKLDYGLMSYDVYQPTKFHQLIKTQKASFAFEQGYGIGFDDLWDRVEWTSL